MKTILLTLMLGVSLSVCGQDSLRVDNLKIYQMTHFCMATPFESSFSTETSDSFKVVIYHGMFAAVYHKTRAFFFFSDTDITLNDSTYEGVLSYTHRATLVMSHVNDGYLAKIHADVGTLYWWFTEE